MPDVRVRVRRQPWFRIACLAAFAGGASERAAAAAIAAELGQNVSRQPVADFRAQDFASLAEPTLTIKAPQQVGIHAEILLFERPAHAVAALAAAARKEPFVSRVDVGLGRYNVIVELMAPSYAAATVIAEQLSADERIVVFERLEALPDALFELARHQMQSTVEAVPSDADVVRAEQAVNTRGALPTSTSKRSRHKGLHSV